MKLDIIGINKGKITQFNNKGIASVEDLIKFLPRKYYDFRNPVPFRQAKDGEYCAVVGTVLDVSSIAMKNSSGKMVRVTIKDSTNWRMTISFFNQEYVAKVIKKNVDYIFCGKVQVKNGNAQMTNPFDFSPHIDKCKRIVPIYSKINGMSDDFLTKSMNSALAIAEKDDYLEPELLRKYGIITYATALRSAHQPFTMEDIKNAEKRFLFDDLFIFNMHMTAKSVGINTSSPFIMEKFDKAKEFMDNLPFDLTEGQRTALRQMSVKMKSGQRLNALVQGDVGCGKTMVAILLMVVAGNNGYQSALMAPTNVLAKQHYAELKEKVEPLGFKVGFLSGDQKAKEKREVLAGIKSGEIDMVVGTHSIIGDSVEFNNLALSVVDEEHRFGVVQRNALKEKADKGVHTITMSATPIPRSLAMSIFGNNIDVITINTLPKGRQPVETVHIGNEEEAYAKMYEEIQKGRQCYIVCPLIEDSDSETLQGVDSVDATHKKAIKYFKDKNVKIGVITGKMKQSDIASEIAKFSNKEYDIIISTTIIEVGVNVPNSTIILIKNAERFGLAQLHQLRGRVGRGSHKSYCILLSEMSTEDAQKKIEAMCSTTNGFVIAKKDLEIRGAGDFVGTQQSGNNKYVMLLIGNPDFDEKIKEEIKNIFNNPGRLNKYKHLLDIDITDK